MRGNRKLKHESHDSFRTLMRVVGPILILIGAGMFFTGIISFTTRFNQERDEFDRNFGNFGAKRVVEPKSPDRFWMCFVGMPIAIAGIFCTKVGYVGAAARYVAGEVAPVANDTINYVVDGTKESIRDVAEAVRGDKGDDAVRCPECGHGNDADARFCKDCGTTLASSCPKCGEANDADAKFCDACGTPMATE